MKRICSTCWGEVGADAEFCALCGAPVQGDSKQNGSASNTAADGLVLPVDNSAGDDRGISVRYPSRGAKTAALMAALVLILIVFWLNLQVKEFNQLRSTGARRTSSAPQPSQSKAATDPDHSAFSSDYAGHWTIIEGPAEVLDGVTEFELAEEGGSLIAVGFEETGFSGFIVDNGMLRGSLEIGSTRVGLTGVLSQNGRELDLRIELPIGPDMIIRATRR